MMKNLQVRLRQMADEDRLELPWILIILNTSGRVPLRGVNPEARLP
jgi:hypothetical protein